MDLGLNEFETIPSDLHPHILKLLCLYLQPHSSRKAIFPGGKHGIKVSYVLNALNSLPPESKAEPVILDDIVDAWPFIRCALLSLVRIFHDAKSYHSWTILQSLIGFKNFYTISSWHSLTAMSWVFCMIQIPSIDSGNFGYRYTSYRHPFHKQMKHSTVVCLTLTAKPCV